MSPPNTSFLGLVRTINGQMLSTASALAIYKRLEKTLPSADSKGWLQVERKTWRSCGLSFAKIDTITTLAKDIVSGKLDLEALSSQSSEDISTVLTAYKGIGAWTAKGYILMGLQKEDIFLGEDLGVRDGVQGLLDLEERPTIKFCMEYARDNWAPYSGTATNLLWHFKEQDKLQAKKLVKKQAKK